MDYVLISNQFIEKEAPPMSKTALSGISIKKRPKTASPDVIAPAASATAAVTAIPAAAAPATYNAFFQNLKKPAASSRPVPTSTAVASTSASTTSEPAEPA